MNEAISKIQDKFDRRKLLIGLHAVCVVVPLIYFTHGTTANPLPPDLASNGTLQAYVFREQAISLYGGLVTSAISLLMLILGAHCVALHEDSSMVVHNSLALWLFHLIIFAVYHGTNNNYKPYDDYRARYLTTAGDVSFNIVMIVLLTIQVIVSSSLLRRHNSVWPRSNLMQLFTLESPLLVARMVLSWFCFGQTLYRVQSLMYRYSCSEECVNVVTITSFHIATVVSQFNLIICLENFITLFWGIPHRKMMGVEAVMSSAFLFIALILEASGAGVPDEDKSSFRVMLVPWFASACVLSLAHGVLNLVFPVFISKVPLVFKGHGMSPQTDTTDAEAPSDGGLPYSRMISGFFSSAPAAQQNPNRKTILQLLKENPSFLRNVSYSVVCTIIFAVLGSAFHYSNTYYFNRWAPVLILCSTTSVILRTFPDMLAELIIRTSLPAQPLVQVFTSIFIESVLLVVGMLGSWVDYFPRGAAWVSDYYHSAAGLGIVILLLHGLHIRTYLK